MVRFPLLLVMVPKPAAPTEVMVVLGEPQIGWFSQLYMLAWNRTWAFSWNRKDLKNEESHVCDDGPRKSGDVRESVPKV